MKLSSYAKPSLKHEDTFRTSEGSPGMNRRPRQRHEPRGGGEYTFACDVRAKPSEVRGRLLKVLNGCDIVGLKDDNSNLYSCKPKEPK